MWNIVREFGWEERKREHERAESKHSWPTHLSCQPLERLHPLLRHSNPTQSAIARVTSAHSWAWRPHSHAHPLSIVTWNNGTHCPAPGAEGRPGKSIWWHHRGGVMERLSDPWPLKEPLGMGSILLLSTYHWNPVSTDKKLSNFDNYCSIMDVYRLNWYVNTH